MSRKERRERIETDGAAPLTLSLGERLGLAAATDKDEVEKHKGENKKGPQAQTAIEAPEKNFSRAVLQRARAGGGRWVVRVLLTPQPGERQLEDLMKDVRRSLGTGARIENGALLVQGDIPDRVREWLVRRGVQKITGP